MGQRGRGRRWGRQHTVRLVGSARAHGPRQDGGRRCVHPNGVECFCGRNVCDDDVHFEHIGQSHTKVEGVARQHRQARTPPRALLPSPPGGHSRRRSLSPLCLDSSLAAPPGLVSLHIICIIIIIMICLQRRAQSPTTKSSLISAMSSDQAHSSSPGARCAPLSLCRAPPRYIHRARPRPRPCLCCPAS